MVIWMQSLFSSETKWSTWTNEIRLQYWKKSNLLCEYIISIKNLAEIKSMEDLVTRNKLTLTDSSISFLNLSWLVSGRTPGHQKLILTFPWINNYLMVTKQGFFKWKCLYDYKQEISKSKCRIGLVYLPYAVGEQLPILLSMSQKLVLKMLCWDWHIHIFTFIL